jgi:hypothetical protein
MLRTITTRASSAPTTAGPQQYRTDTPMSRPSRHR